MQKIKVASIETKEGDNDRGHWTNYIVTGEDNTKASTFDHKAASIKVGDVIEAEIELKGKFANIKEFVVLHAAPGVKPEPPQTGKPRGESPGQRESIECQVAAKIIAELRIADKLSDTSPEYKAMLAWCRERLGVELTKADDIHHGGKDTEKVKKEPAKPKRDSSTIKTFGDLYPACDQDFHLKTRKAVWAELNVGSQEEIVDTPADCYEKIAASRR